MDINKVEIAKQLIDKIDNDRYDIKVNEIITDNQKKVL